MQNRYNLAARGGEDVVDYCERERLGFIPWFPLADGDLTRRDGPLSAFSDRLGATPAQLALAWLAAPLAGDAAGPRDLDGDPL